MSAIELTNVSKSIKGKQIIKDLNFKVEPGEVFGFIGPNGAGKTTTIRMIAGLVSISEGDVTVMGHSITKEFSKAIRHVGAIVENPEVYPFLTGMQNLKYYRRMIPGITKARIDEVVSLVGLEKAINQKAGRYSLGMRQRLGIAQALLHKPSVLILDEPTNGLDPAGIREIRQYIRALAKNENVAVIISSHFLAEIELMCDRIGIVKNGALIDVQSVDDTTTDTTELRQVSIEVDQPEVALESVKAAHQIDGDIVDGLVRFEINKDTIPLIIQTLVEKDLLIYKVETSKTRLEDKFFDVIGENVIE
ncbi:ABC transporter ATP-binding protein [Aliicoccus persicus]|uniref:ABC-2 type transport system ATP-binding protein n=1 Tax=Aliicoccus persicus TaxID=930138 RepID=A0A662Z4I6_9STAP|nr:ABC transporter ATP-binding protein [Aliicoccus persicus]SEW11976.1 ABC-2 type transport system ATP-binding protein [Aliicoccus persicus]